MSAVQPGGQEQMSRLTAPEPQPRFRDTIQKIRDRLKAEVFTKSSPLRGLPDKPSLTLKQVRSMFLVKELSSLRDSTTLEETNQLQYWPRKSQEGGIELSANVDSAGSIRLSSYDLDPSSKNGEQYTYASFDERQNWQYKRGRIYDMALQTDMHGNSTRLMGRYATGLLFDRVSLRYYSDGQMHEVKKTFLRNPLTALRKSPSALTQSADSSKPAITNTTGFKRYEEDVVQYHPHSPQIESHILVKKGEIVDAPLLSWHSNWGERFILDGDGSVKVYLHGGHQFRDAEPEDIRRFRGEIESQLSRKNDPKLRAFYESFFPKPEK